MITKFKLFEEINVGEPKVGDYVICEEIPQSTPKFQYADVIEFLKNNIGKIKKISYNPDPNLEGVERYSYIVAYNNIPLSLITYFLSGKNNARRMFKDNIIYWSKDRDELETILLSKKYNVL